MNYIELSFSSDGFLRNLSVPPDYDSHFEEIFTPMTNLTCIIIINGNHFLPSDVLVDIITRSSETLISFSAYGYDIGEDIVSAFQKCPNLKKGGYMKNEYEHYFNNGSPDDLLVKLWSIVYSRLNEDGELIEEESE